MGFKSIASIPGIAMAVVPTFFLLGPVVLAGLTCLTRKKKKKSLNSAIYSGRVWHTRFKPSRHAFQYPIFVFCLDLVELENGSFAEALGFLRWIATFREKDHLKDYTENSEGSFLERLVGMIQEKTNNTFQPTREQHHFFLVTHLMYYGYCFNPVSFYYIQNRATGKIEAMVGEVSNTPWNEMHCYVLHPASLDSVNVSDDRGNDPTASTDITPPDDDSIVSYTFPKSFHVSPFMEMHYNYEWTFHNFLVLSSTNAKNSLFSSTPLRVTNNLRNLTDGSLQFHARMILPHRHELRPFSVAWHLCIFPVKCMLVQVWIHYEAFFLFLKGVPYQPHPQGSETTASRCIGSLMAPLFALQEWWMTKSLSSQQQPQGITSKRIQ